MEDFNFKVANYAMEERWGEEIWGLNKIGQNGRYGLDGRTDIFSACPWHKNKDAHDTKDIAGERKLVGGYETLPNSLASKFALAESHYLTQIRTDEVDCCAIICSADFSRRVGTADDFGIGMTSQGEAVCVGNLLKVRKVGKEKRT